MQITVLGAGAWGTTLANLLSRGENRVRLWGHDPAHIKALGGNRINPACAAFRAVDPEVRVEWDLDMACQSSEGLVIAVPSKGMRSLAHHLASALTGSIPIVSVTKGIEFETGLTMCGVLLDAGLPNPVAALSGPTLAEEVFRGMPSAVVLASDCQLTALWGQALFHRPSFRVYASEDRLGVELGGALKNVIAIAAGVSDGLGFGDNSKAALVTRAIVEIRRLGVACGAHDETFSGLSGLGDLTVTCFSKLSRNRAMGERLGKGEPVDKVLGAMTSVAEGYPTARSAWQLARAKGINTPIIDEVYSMLYEGKDVKEALKSLVARDSKWEGELGRV